MRDSKEERKALEKREELKLANKAAADKRLRFMISIKGSSSLSARSYL